jgi:endonuclease-3
VTASTRRTRPRRARETAAARARRAAAVYAALAEEYPDARCELDHRDPYELLVATILSAQCTDKRVNLVTPALFARYPTPAHLRAADPTDLEDLIRSTGFFRAKTRNLLGAANVIADRFGGAVPAQMEDLVTLPGVGRKTANVVLGNAFGIASGVVVDTHVARLTRRLGFTRAADPVKIERDLMPLFPSDQWTMLAHLLIWHGRRVCVARTPRCADCVVAKLCPSRQPPPRPAKRASR